MVVLLALHSALLASVKIYEDATFDSTVSTGTHFVKFYAPWCGHCRALEPTWEALAESIEGEEISVAKVDCTREVSLGSRMYIRGYPTLILFADGGAAHKYEGARSPEALTEFARGGYKGTPPSWYPSRLLYTPISALIVVGTAVEKGLTKCLEFGPAPCMAIGCGGIILLSIVLVALVTCCCTDSSSEPQNKKANASRKARSPKAD